MSTRIAALAAPLRAQSPARTRRSLLLATWNVREFDTPGYGVRSDECLGYIARIVSSFEIVALQEVRGEYNQMALLPGGPLQCTGRAGVLDYYESVYRTRDERSYVKAMGAAYAGSKDPAQYYRSRWRTFQMSDHLPMWMELKVP